jgi:hypothetical protein
VPGGFFIASVIRDSEAFCIGTNFGFVSVRAP